MKKALVAMMCVVLAGCSVHSIYDRSYVSNAVGDRTGHSLRAEDKTGALILPENVSLSDGLTEEEAVAIALWNNAQFQADLAELGFARADLLDAGLLRNPVLSFLFPLGPKQLEATLNLPVEVLWQRPKRVAVAKLNVERVAENLVQHGLNFTRDILTAYADLLFARQRAGLLEEEASLQKEIAAIASSRLKAGDISELEETAFRLEAAQAAEASVRSARDAQISEDRFKTLLGIGMDQVALLLSPSPIGRERHDKPSDLMAVAFASRPVLRAAELGLEAAGKRVGWERSKIFNLIATLDANGEGKEGFEMGPGFQLELPVLNQNQGKISRAQEELKQAAHQYTAIKHQIAREVLEAAGHCQAAQQSLKILRSEILPAAGTAVKNAEKAYALGAISYLELLNFKRQLSNARLREAEAEAELRKAEANLKHSTGFKPLEKIEKSDADVRLRRP